MVVVKKEHDTILVLLFIAALALHSLTAQPVAPQFQIREAATGVRITIAGAHAATWPTVESGDTAIPAQLVAVGLDDPPSGEPRISTLDGRPWARQLRPRERPIPQANGQARPDLAPAQATTIPTEPITLLRDGQSRGQPIRVLVVGAIIERDGELCQITRLDATIPGAHVIDEATPASVTEEAPPSAPTANPAAQRQALRVPVREAGMQRISRAHLAHLGASRVHVDPAQLQRHHAGQEIALQLLGAEDDRIDAGDALRFYAPDPGDRWNQAATSWLTVEDQPGRRIEPQDSGPGTAPQRTTVGVSQRGMWRTRCCRN